MRIRVEYTCDWSDDDGDSLGRIIVHHPDGGMIVATWECRGGMGGGAEVKSNTTAWDDVAADDLVNSTDLCQGIGTFEADLGKDEHGWPKLSNVEWLEDEQPYSPVLELEKHRDRDVVFISQDTGDIFIVLPAGVHVETDEPLAGTDADCDERDASNVEVANLGDLLGRIDLGMYDEGPEVRVLERRS